MKKGEEKNNGGQARKIPDYLIKSINENSGGTFFLFIVDGEGRPSCHIQSDNATMQQGLVEQLKAAIEALETARDMDNQMWKQNILAEMGIEQNVIFDMDMDLDDLDLDDD